MFFHLWEIVNWVTTADGCVHTADATRLDSFVSSSSAVCIGLNICILSITDVNIRERTGTNNGVFRGLRLSLPRPFGGEKNLH